MSLPMFLPSLDGKSLFERAGAALSEKVNKEKKADLTTTDTRISGSASRQPERQANAIRNATKEIKSRQQDTPSITEASMKLEEEDLPEPKTTRFEDVKDFFSRMGEATSDQRRNDFLYQPQNQEVYKEAVDNTANAISNALEDYDMGYDPRLDYLSGYSNADKASAFDKARSAFDFATDLAKNGTENPRVPQTQQTSQDILDGLLTFGRSMQNGGTVRNQSPTLEDANTMLDFGRSMQAASIDPRVSAVTQDEATTSMENAPKALDEFGRFASNPADYLFAEDTGILDPGKAPLINGSEEDRERVRNAPNRYATPEVSTLRDRSDYKMKANRLRMEAEEPENESEAYIRQHVDTIESDPQGERSNLMTGEKYIWYINEMGTGGRDPRTIDPNKVYNKLDEFKYYGFTPIIDNKDQLTSMYADNAIGGPGALVNKFADVLEDNRGDYFIDYGGQRINGDQFDNAAYDYFSKVVGEELSNPADNRYISKDQLTDTILNDPNYAKFKIKGMNITDENGEVFELEGATNFVVDQAMMNLIEQTGDTSLPIDVYPKLADGSDYLDEDGDPLVISFDSLDELNNSGALSWSQELAMDPNDPDIIGAIRVDPMMLDDMQVPYMSAYDISQNQAGDYDFGPMNINKPRDRQESFIEWDDESNGFKMNFEDFVPGMINMGLNSLPYMAPWQIMAPATVSNMYRASQGLDARSLDGLSYQNIAENITDDRYKANVMGEAFIPLSEKAFGVGGQEWLNPATWLRGGIKNSKAFPLIETAGSILGEGFEEVVQEPIEQAQQHGVAGMFADQLIDEYGYPVFDASGHEVKDVNTPFINRAFNYGKEIPNDMLAGSLMGAGFSVPNIFSSAARTYNNFVAPQADSQINSRITAEMIKEARDKGYV